MSTNASSEEGEVPPQVSIEKVELDETEFSHVVDKEIDRIKLLAEKENKRIMDLQQKNEAKVRRCPICLESLPTVLMEDEMLLYMKCCGVSCHPNCMIGWELRVRTDPTLSKSCFYCGDEKYSTYEEFRSVEAYSLKCGTFDRARVVTEKGFDYECGKNGKTQDLEEALRCFIEAEALGDARAQVHLAEILHSGKYFDMGFRKEPARAMENVHGSVDQGNSRAKWLLAQLLTEGKKFTDLDSAEAYRLYSLGAYQGNLSCFMQLTQLYSKNYGRLERKINKSAQEETKARQYLLLSLYWAGKVYGKKLSLERNIGALYMSRFLSYLCMTMKVCHGRELSNLESLTRYHHTPFITWVLAKIARDNPTLRTCCFETNGVRKVPTVDSDSLDALLLVSLKFGSGK
jgi:hypothetical protein